MAFLGYVPWNEDEDYFTSTLAGSGVTGSANGAGANATFNQPAAVAIDTLSQILYISDRGNNMVRSLNVATSTVDTLVGSVAGYSDGVGADALLREPSGIAIDPYAGMVYVADSVNCVVRTVEISSRRSSTLAGTAGVSGFTDGQGVVAAFSQPTGLALHVRARQLFVCDPFNHAVRVINVDSGAVRTLCGTGIEGAADGPGAAATLLLPFAVTVDEQARLVFITDRTAHVRRATMSDEPAVPSTDGDAYSASVTTVNGDNASLASAGGLAYAYGWDSIIVADLERSTLQRLALTGSDGSRSNSSTSDGFSLLAGGLPGDRDGMGIEPRFYRPEGVAIDYTTQALYVADTYNHRIRLMALTDVEDVEEEHVPSWSEVLQKALEHNLVLILVVAGSTLGACLFTYLCCRFCLFCPLYKRKLHEKRVRSMYLGERV